MLTSIIIPTYNHAEKLGEAVAGALRQTAAVHVVVIDDGSTDATQAVMRLLLEANAGRLSLLTPAQHGGVSRARNFGIEFSRNADFIMFLDADDVIAPDKVEKQLAVMDDGVGWVLCDVLIRKVDGSETTASEQYDYARKGINGWLQPKLAPGNIIPIMSPLVRREVIGDIRFNDDLKPEDWHFWYAISGVARCRYVPEVLATYRKQPRSRNTRTKPHPAKRPGVVEPLRLNLGCGTPDTRSWHPMPGMVNLDKSLGWRFEDGLGDFLDGSVSGITISHALMYVGMDAWPRVFAEFARVLKPGGILRITEDDTANPQSTRIGGWRGSEPAIALTDPVLLRRYMEQVGFTVHDVSADVTVHEDNSLRQAQHGEPPDVFFIEGVRECALLLSPHADDESLFAAFTIIRHKPHVVICFPSSGDYGDTDTRTEESRQAVAILGGGVVEQWDGKDLLGRMHELDNRLKPSRVWAPSVQTSHPDHLAVAQYAEEVFGDRLTHFHTYTAGGKMRRGDPVAFEQSWVSRKRQALGCYATQWKHPRACVFFDDDLAEYME